MRPVPPALMVFAAGFGTRMGALTAHKPKPLLSVAGKILLDHALDLADGAGVRHVVVNTHYLSDQIAMHLAGRSVTQSHEADEILETGGGLRAALPLLGTNPVLTLNSDVVWTGQNPLTTLMTAWRPDSMDALLMVMPAGQAGGFRGLGDFTLSPDGRIARANDAAGLAYLGAQLIKTDLLAEIPEHVFSLNRLWDILIARGRAFGIVHQGGWHDVGRPEHIADAAAMLSGSGDV
jgi:N-acetyl-alpha-D-muramate 1-phosphate uridylyltransferase